MANELSLHLPLVAFQFTISNVAQGAVTDGVLAGGNGKGGPVVPTGYKFIPVFIDVESNDACTAGVATIKVTTGGTELANGPEATLNTTDTLTDTGLSTTKDSVAAGAEVGVSATGDGSWAPATADLDVVLYGFFAPA